MKREYEAKLEDQSRFIYTAEDMIRERQEGDGMLEAYRQAAGEREKMKQEYDGRLDEGLETTRKKLATMEREYKPALEEIKTMKREH